jgi:2-(1,2-epoxy-1,2-dihydrophenyl)acetyl-CoA isomerase
VAQGDSRVDGLAIEHSDAALVITLDRPERKNALTAQMIDGIISALNAADADDSTRIVVLRANGADFCSGIDLVQSSDGIGPDGGDIKTSRPRTGHLQRSFQHGAHKMILALDSVQVPIVSVVRGWAVGIGNALALSADVVLASTTAQFWVPFVGKGFTPDSANTWLLPRLVGLRRAKEMVLRAQPISGELAAEWGLITRCVDDGQLEVTLGQVVAELESAATVAYGLARTLLHRNLDASLTAALQNEAIYEELAVRSDDFKEGLRAFHDKRHPDFTGW